MPNSYFLKSLGIIWAINIGLFAVAAANASSGFTYPVGGEQVATIQIAHHATTTKSTVRAKRSVPAKNVTSTATTTKATTTKKTITKRSVAKPISKVVQKKTIPKPKPAVPTPALVVSTAPKPVVTIPTNTATELEELILVMMNKERAKKNLKPLSADIKLTSIARGHSLDMLENDYFNHVNQNGCSTECRIDKAGYEWMSYGENIHWMSGFAFTPEVMAEKIMTDWMSSAGHRTNILGEDFTMAGVGVATEGDTFYTTVDYSLPE